MESDRTPGPGSVRFASTSFVGRQREFEILRIKLDEASTGRGSLTMLVGEAGIGKTWLAQRLAEEAGSRGAVVLWGRCFEGDWQPPYGPWVEAVAEYTRSADPEFLRAKLGAGARSIARLVPQVLAALPDTPLPALLSPDEERLRLCDALTRFLLVLAEEKPVALVLDDLHWADRDSLWLLRYLCRFVSSARLLVIGAYREPDLALAEGSPLADTLAALRREAGYEHVVVHGLSSDEAAEYLARAAGRELPAGLVQAIHGESNGNPFYLREILQHLLEQGEGLDRAGYWATELGTGNLGIPEGVRQVVSSRLSRLSAETIRLLQLAAGLSAGFSFPVLQALTGLAESALLDGIDEALKAGFIRVGHETPPSYDFAHAIVRHALLEECNPDRRARLHRRIAMALEEAYAGHELEHAAELAAQYRASLILPGAARGIPYALAAAEQARERAALQSAADLLRVARDLAAGGDPSRYAEILCKLAIAEAEALLLDEAGQTAQAALVALAAAETEPAMQADFLATICRALKDGGAPRDVWQPLLERGLALVGDERGLVWARLALLQDRFEPISRGEINASLWTGLDPEAVAVARASGDEEDYALTLAPLDWRSREETEATIALARRWRRPTAIMRALDIATRDLVYNHGALREAISRAQDLLEIGERYGSLPAQAEAISQIAGAHIVIGELATAQQTMQRAQEVIARLGVVHRLHGIAIGEASALAYFVDGDWRSLAAAASDFAASEEAGNSPYALLGATFAALAFACAGMAAEARHLLGLITPLTPRVVPRSYGLNAIVSLAGSAIWDLEAVDYAGSYRHLAFDLLEAGVGQGPIGPHELTIARMAVLLGDPVEAEQYFGLARRHCETKGSPNVRAIVDYDEALALMRWRSTDRMKVGTLLEAALATFESLGMTRWISRGRALKERLAAPRARCSTACRDYPAGLTAREVDVLRLIARGRTNNEIAVALVISLATVERHITNLYGKIDARGRADATAYALRHGLIEPQADDRHDFPHG